jgi:polyisoprenoid-binding protein YceI
VAVADLGTDLERGSFAGTWTLDPSRSTVGLVTKAMWGIVPVKGEFSDLAGSAVVTDAGAVSGRLEVKSASINTRMKKRDEHLRSDDFFASDRVPAIVFEVDSVTPSGDGVAAAGRLTVRDTTLPLVVAATVADLTTDAVTFDAEIVVDRSDFGLDFRAKGATKMDNTISVHAVFTRA